MVNLQEEELIYFNKTKEYFKGVMADYSIENYRSAIVMLYAVAICDLLFKLQELRDSIRTGWIFESFENVSYGF